MPDGLKKRWQCWKLRWFVKHFRPDICVKHGVAKVDVAAFARHSIWYCDLCSEEYAAKVRQDRATQEALRAAAELQHQRNTEEILEALKHCKECK